KSLLPGDVAQFAALADHWPRWSAIVRAGDSVETAAVAQPAVVDVRIRARDQSQHRLRATVDLDVAADRTAVAHRRGADQVPGTGLEAVLAAGQRADRA